MFGQNGKVHDNSFRDCGQGGPSYGIGTAAMNVFGTNMYIYNNQAEKSGICAEITLRDGVFANNLCSHVARYGTGVSTGSDQNGVWNMVVENNIFKNMYAACEFHGTSGGFGTMDRLHVVHNIYINSPNCAVQDGVFSNYPGFEKDTAVHYFSEFSHNVMSFPTYYDANTIYGVQVTAAHERWVLDSNTIIMPPTQAGDTKNEAIQIQQSARYWAPSTAYSKGVLVQKVRPVPGNDFFMASGNCTSAAAEPAWVATAGGTSTTTDNTCTWTYQGKLAVHELSNNRIIGNGTGRDNPYCDEIALDTVPENVQLENNSISYQGGCLKVENSLRPLPSDGVALIQSMTMPQNGGVSDGSRYSFWAPGHNPFKDSVPVLGYYKVGQVIWQYKPTANFMWIVTREGFAAPVWESRRNYSYMSLVVPATDNGHIYANVAGNCTSGPSQPAFPVGTDQTVADNSCTWREVGAAAAFTLH